MNKIKAVSKLASVPLAPADPILSLTTAFQADSNPNKINLGVGAYRDNEGKPWLLPSVKEATERVHNLLQHSQKGVNFEYIPILGSNSYRETVQRFLFSHRTMKTSTQLKTSGSIFTMQGLSGTGSLRVITDFLSKFYDMNAVHVPNPTWANHIQIIKSSNLNVGKYRYYDPISMGLDIEGLLTDLKKIPKGDGVLLHVCCHNPTGVDPSIEQWTEIIDVVVDRGLVPVLDMAYQGFGSGLEEDLQVVELFSQRVHDGTLAEYFLAQSWAKNMGLYGERVGSLSVVGGSREEITRAQSQFALIARGMYSSPPGNGARIVEAILEDGGLFTQWGEDVDLMGGRLREMRVALYEALLEIDCRGPGNESGSGWEHLTEQRGMFCFTGLSPQQVEGLIKRSVYLTGNGRISIAGITPGNVTQLAESIKQVMMN